MQKSARDARNDYYRQWRANNKDRIREYNARYWAKRAERMAQERRESEVNKFETTYRKQP